MVAGNKIRGLIAERRMTLVQVADALHISPRTLNNKLNTGKFYVDEADALVELLGIEDPRTVFFVKEVN